jgi:cytochrome P450
LEQINSSSQFTKSQLLVVCDDLFSAGAESTSNTIAFAILYMILYPDVQVKVQTELDNVVGRDRFPGWGDSARLVMIMNMDLHDTDKLRRKK